jgi:hypothetical protein
MANAWKYVSQLAVAACLLNNQGRAEERPTALRRDGVYCAHAEEKGVGGGWPGR